MTKQIALLFFIMSSCQVLFAQQTDHLFDAVDYNSIEIPPLEVLFENAKKSPSVEMFEARMMEQDNELKSEKRSWLKYFKVGGSWQYGNIGVNSMFTDEYTPLFYQYSGATQNSFFANGTVSVPLDDLFDRGNRIKRQKMARRTTELEMDKWFDEQKIRIVNSYVKVVNAIAVLKRKMENLTTVSAQLKMVENEFKNGNASITDLSTARKMEMEAFETYKMTQTTITSEILNLEILSKTQIISR